MKDSSKLLNPERWPAGRKIDVSFQEAVDEANAGSLDLRKVFDQAGKALGIGISQLITLINPEKIIITGITEIKGTGKCSLTPTPIRRRIPDPVFSVWCGTM